MKTNLSKLMFAAVGMTLSAAAAYGQGQMNANVPFAFQTVNASLSAGSYDIKVVEAGSRLTLQIENRSSRHSILAVANSREYGTTGKARLVFRCREVGGCALAEAYDGSGAGWHFAQPRRTSAEQERLAVVFIHRADGE